MSARVSIFQWIIEAVAVPVQCLRIAEALDYCIRADKPPNASIIIPCSVVVKPGIVKPLTGKEFIGCELVYGRRTISTFSKSDC